MADGEPDPKVPEDELAVIDLHPRRVRSGGVRPPRVGARTWRWLALGVSLLLLAVLLSRLPLVHNALGGLARAPASPTASPTATAEPLLFLTPATTPGVRLATPTAVPGATGVPALGLAPARCVGPPPAPNGGETRSHLGCLQPERR
jgi:hypothetical protein